MGLTVWTGVSAKDGVHVSLWSGAVTEKDEAECWGFALRRYITWCKFLAAFRAFLKSHPSAKRRNYLFPRGEQLLKTLKKRQLLYTQICTLTGFSSKHSGTSYLKSLFWGSCLNFHSNLEHLARSTGAPADSYDLFCFLLLWHLLTSISLHHSAHPPPLPLLLPSPPHLFFFFFFFTSEW